jgi:hypothetical protein
MEEIRKRMGNNEMFTRTIADTGKESGYSDQSIDDLSQHYSICLSARGDDTLDSRTRDLY